MLKKFLLGVLLLFVSSSVSAENTVRYGGLLQWTMDKDDETEMKYREILVKNENGLFTLYEEFFEQAMVLAIQDHDLFQDGIKVGSINDEEWRIQFDTSGTDWSCSHIYKMTKTDVGFKYLDVDKCDDGMFDRVEGDVTVIPQAGTLR